MTTNMRRQRKALIATTLPSDIPPVIDAFGLPIAAKRWGSDEGELRGTLSNGSALSPKDLVGMAENVLKQIAAAPHSIVLACSIVLLRPHVTGEVRNDLTRNYEDK
jgi:hypothetical protein